MKNVVCWMMLSTLALIFVGCGMITDKDRKVIAEVDGEPIRRAELRKYLRDLGDEKRPIIQTQEDLLRVLNEYINTNVKSQLAQELLKNNLISVSRDVAKEQYLEKNPEFRNMESMVQSKDLGFTQGQIAAMKAQIEFGIDDEEDLLLQEAAIEYRVNELIQSGGAKVSDQEFAQEYERSKDSFKSYEYIDFIAIRFPFDNNNSYLARQEAVKAYDRILKGESFDAVLDSYMRQNKQFGMRSAFENNPDKTVFTQFWHNVTGCNKGDILGPLLLPPHDQVRQGPNGQTQTVKAPPAWLVLHVEDHRPPTQKTLDEAKPDMAMMLLGQQVMNTVRDEHGVVVYPENLWRPEGYGDQYKDSMIDMSGQGQQQPIP